ncbi:MAG TPA: AprI/Inh family metalloprotease inhibitor [Caulobacteraceae bacterium]
MMRLTYRRGAGGLVAALCLCGASAASAEDNQAGQPLDPKDAAGAWTLQSQGATICVVRLSARRAASGFGFQGSPQCGEALPHGAVGWRPTADGMALVGADGASLIAFGRWSNSLFVSHRASGIDLQLKRGLPGPSPAAN